MAGGIGERAAAWVYEGVWGVLARWFRVPEHPPRLPGEGDAEAVRPAPEFLRYLKFKFWVLLAVIDVAILLPWLILVFIRPVVAMVLAVPVWAAAILPDIAAYVAIHLRYDTTWYLFTQRAMRIRRGIWTIHEATITYENVQNVAVYQGPLQRWFGIWNVVVRTAGGGGGGQAHAGHGSGGGHVGIVEGVADGPAVRDRVMERVRQSRSAGLGDERHGEELGGAAVMPLLREIRDAARELAGPTSARF
jgi:membrane protein YdbS with pleckstrin-like domain